MFKLTEKTWYSDMVILLLGSLFLYLQRGGLEEVLLLNAFVALFLIVIYIDSWSLLKDIDDKRGGGATVRLGLAVGIPFVLMLPMIFKIGIIAILMALSAWSVLASITKRIFRP